MRTVGQTRERQADRMSSKRLLAKNFKKLLILIALNTVVLTAQYIWNFITYERMAVCYWNYMLRIIAFKYTMVEVVDLLVATCFDNKM
jgi:hypothetical protein